MYKKLILVCVIAVVCCAPLCGVGIGANKAADQSVKVKKLLLSPAAEPAPAMRYRLLPLQLDKKTGNAALLYYAAAALCPNGKDDSVSDKIAEWRDVPVDELPRKEVERALSSFSKCLRQIELATQRADCQWEMPTEEGFSMQVPHLATFRRMIFALQLKIRLAVADGRTDEAFEMLQRGLQMGSDIAKGPTLIQDLVGIACTAVMLREVEGLMQKPDSPNLYWALAALPEPMVDIYSSLEFERRWVFTEFPELRDLENEILTAAQASKIASGFIRKLTSFDNDERDMPFQNIMPVGWVMMHYSDAKQFLADKGYSSKRIEAMPAAQAVLIYQKQEYLEMVDNMFKWFAFPYYQSRPYLEQAEKQMGKHRRDKGAKVNLFTIFFPALLRVAFLEARLDRDIAMLQTIEAIRLHAADHSGQLPASLADISLVPVPTDPVTGESFLYRRINARNARLEAPVSPAESKKRPVYELTVRR